MSEVKTSDLAKQIQAGTLKNRDELLEAFRGYKSTEIIRLTIETMMAYSQDDDALTGQYMMWLDAFRAIMIERGLILRRDCWTLEEFLDDVPFHSDFYSDGKWRSEESQLPTPEGVGMSREGQRKS